MYLVEVYVTNASLNVNRPFTYLSETPIRRFCRVKVIFHHAENAAIVSDCRYTASDREELRQEYGYEMLNILEVIDEEPVISEELFDLAFWLSRTTISPLISCLNSMLPKTLKTSRNTSGPKMVRKFHIIDGDFDLTVKQQAVYDSLYEGILSSEARKMSPSIISKLLEKGAIQEYEEESFYQNSPIDQTSFKELTKDQQKAFEGVLETDRMVSLLFGVTGSGKTEVYLHLARHYLSLNKNVLILVPEIALTPQMIERVKERFNDVVFYHSELSDQERYEQYKRVKEGEVKIVVGTRSAVFLPFQDLGLIIIDEEHDPSYKQDNTPCYHARNVAFRRAMTNHAKVLLASATPSLESYTRALRGDYQMLRLESRINHRLPKIQLVDLTNQIRKKNSYIISSDLDNELRTCLNNNKQAII
ncbi:MAG: primosomal protein N', partial [Erysipelotrichaceae bacterium]|nr:primosomal protein N' [Erysipelotrichaceae bacterium]